MKIILSVICSLFLIGCSESTPQSNESTNTISNEVKKDSALPEENKTVVPEPLISTAVVTPATEVAVSVDGEVVFTQKCASCHGAKAEKSALGKSQVIAGWKNSQVKDALRGYQAGTYGKDMKVLMQGQAKGLNDAQIDALAQYISTL